VQEVCFCFSFLQAGDDIQKEASSVKIKNIFALILIFALVVVVSACSSEPVEDVYRSNDANEVDEPIAELPEPANGHENNEDNDEEHQPNEPAEAEWGSIHGAIHRVEYGNNVAYLFGTIHGGDPSWFPLAYVVEDALRRADVVAVEVAEIGLGHEAVNEAIMEVLFLPDGLTWNEFLPEDYYMHLVEMMDAWGIVYEEVNAMNPSYLVH